MNQVKLSNNVKRQTVMADNNAKVIDIIASAGMPTDVSWQMGGMVIANLNNTLADLGVADDTPVWLNRVVKADCAAC